MSVNEKLTSIADNIRAKTGGTELLDLDDMAQGVNQVYAAGKRDAGTESDYDSFWDTFQDNGKRVNYNYGFGGHGWVKDTFIPKYDMKPTFALGMFMSNQFSGMFNTHLESLGIQLDFSDCKNVSSLFNGASRMTHLGVMNFSNATNTSSAFSGMSLLISIKELVVTKSTPFSNTFQSCSNLTLLKVTGTIGTNGLNVQWSTRLTHDSLMSIINALEDKSTASGTFTITLGSSNKAKLTTDEILIAENKGWTVK